jgi:hypothetical protein
LAGESTERSYNDIAYNKNGNRLISKAAWDRAEIEFQKQQKAFIKNQQDEEKTKQVLTA